MERFTYARTGTALRTKVSMMAVLASSDIIFWLGLTLLLRRPWNWVVLGGGLLLTAWVLWIIASMLRRFHTLDGEALHLAFTRYNLRIARGDVRSAAAAQGPLPRDVDDAGLSYRPQDDTLYILAGKRGLVALELSRPYEAKVPRKGICQFTRVVLSLDEPERFLAALAGSAPAEPAVAAAVGPSAPPGAGLAGPAEGRERRLPEGTGPKQAVPEGTGAEQTVPEGTGAEMIRLVGLVRRYGDFTAVRGIDLSVRSGEVLAFLGSNGAGKTTTIRMMTGLLRPSAGRVLIEGRDLWQEGPSARRLVGYVPDVPLLYESLTAREFLWLMAGLYRIPEAEGRKRAEEMLAMMKLERWGDQQIRSFSLGMKRKMAIATALLHRPSVLLLDEVTNGLDARAAREVKDLVKSWARQGVAVVLTTHILSIAEELSDRIGLIHKGRLIAMGTKEELAALAGKPEANLEEIFLTLTGDDLPAQMEEEPA